MNEKNVECLEKILQDYKNLENGDIMLILTVY